MVGPNWPYQGEIDILEGVNAQSSNQMTMHTGTGCSLAGSDCQGSLGCHIKPEKTSNNNYGTNLNNGEGGVYAVEWTSEKIDIWFFPRHSGLPWDSLGPNPNPAAWGPATASFVGGSGCNIDSHFKDHHIVFDTTFCGDWAGSVWGQDSTCSALGGSCQAYVQNHPEAFADSYWTVNSLKVYQDNGEARVEEAKVGDSEKPDNGAVFAEVPSEATSSEPKTTNPPLRRLSPKVSPQQTRKSGDLFQGPDGSINIVPRDVTDTGSEVHEKKMLRHLHKHVHHLHHSG